MFSRATAGRDNGAARGVVFVDFGEKVEFGLFGMSDGFDEKSGCRGKSVVCNGRFDGLSDLFGVSM